MIILITTTMCHKVLVLVPKCILINNDTNLSGTRGGAHFTERFGSNWVYIRREEILKL